MDIAGTSLYWPVEIKLRKEVWSCWTHNFLIPTPLHLLLAILLPIIPLSKVYLLQEAYQHLPVHDLQLSHQNDSSLCYNHKACYSFIFCWYVPWHPGQLRRVHCDIYQQYTLVFDMFGLQETQHLLLEKEFASMVCLICDTLPIFYNMCPGRLASRPDT